jgi:hypothetical protein
MGLLGCPASSSIEEETMNKSAHVLTDETTQAVFRACREDGDTRLDVAGQLLANALALLATDQEREVFAWILRTDAHLLDPEGEEVTWQ